MRTIRFTARLRWGQIDRTLAEFTAMLADDQIEEAGAFMKMLAGNGQGIEIFVADVPSDEPLVVTAPGGGS